MQAENNIIKATVEKNDGNKVVQVVFRNITAIPLVLYERNTDRKILDCEVRENGDKGTAVLIYKIIGGVSISSIVGDVLHQGKKVVILILQTFGVP